MEQNLGNTRSLLRDLREVMALPFAAQERLNRIAQVIGENLNAEVCSIYVLRTDNRLELFASLGLDAKAVHQTALEVGEGLVGRVAQQLKPINVSDAPAHRNFAFVPETKEERFSSFLGVPVLRAGRMLGVLVVQNTYQRHYSDEEVELLETTAMVLAEAIASPEMAKLGESHDGLEFARPRTLEAECFSEGLCFGRVKLHDRRVEITKLIGDDPKVESARLVEAVNKLVVSIDALLAKNQSKEMEETREVLETYRMFANDQGWMRRMQEAIRNGLTAEAAVEKVQSDHRAKMRRINDPLLRDRLSDLDDLGFRLLRELSGRPQTNQNDLFDDETVVVAKNIGAAELLDYASANIQGLVLEEGSPTSHAVIVAKAMDIPVLGRAKNIVSIAQDGDPILFDAAEAKVHLRPGHEVRDAFLEKQKIVSSQREKYQALRDLPTQTLDGHSIKLQMNAGLLVDMDQLAINGAEGVGLFRTEFQFMIASTFPRPGQQEQFYRQILAKAEGKPVTFRTLDVGGDKILPYLNAMDEENPALGWRALRISLDRPALMKVQVRALLKACDGGPLRLLLPMVTDVSEVDRAREIIQHELVVLERLNHPLPSSVLIGGMLEVPSLLFQLDEFLNSVDFVSIGSNDLFQFLHAVDRGNANLTNRFDPLSWPFFRALRSVAEAGMRHGKEITVCGELAGTPLGTLGLAAIGFRNLSLSPGSIGPVKYLLRKCNLEELQAKMMPGLNGNGSGNGSSKSLRRILKDYVRDIDKEVQN